MTKKKEDKSEFDTDFDIIGGDRIPSSLKGINACIGGGYVPGNLYNYYGEPESRKTTLAFQESFADCKYYKEEYGEEKAILFFDTEGGARLHLQDWYKVYSKRFGVKPKIIYRKLTDLLEILKFFGYPINVDVSKKGKVMIRPEGHKSGSNRVIYDRNPPIRQLCIEHNVGSIVIDSVTEPIDQMFIGGQVQFPTRADAINAWFGRIHWLAEPATLTSSGEDERRVVRCILHESVDPAKKKAIWKAVIKGGHNTKYKFKIVLWLWPSPKIGYSHIIRVYLARYPSKKAFDTKAYVVHTDDGLVDPTKKQAEKLFKDKELFGHEKITFGKD